jgi:hypothetical protein
MQADEARAIITAGTWRPSPALVSAVGDMLLAIARRRATARKNIALPDANGGPDHLIVRDDSEHLEDG